MKNLLLILIILFTTNIFASETVEFESLLGEAIRLNNSEGSLPIRNKTEFGAQLRELKRHYDVFELMASTGSFGMNCWKLGIIQVDQRILTLLLQASIQLHDTDVVINGNQKVAAAEFKKIIEEQVMAPQYVCSHSYPESEAYKGADWAAQFVKIVYSRLDYLIQLTEGK